MAKIESLGFLFLTFSFIICLSSSQNPPRRSNLFSRFDRFSFNFASLTGNETDPDLEPEGTAGGSLPDTSRFAGQVRPPRPIDPPTPCLPPTRCPSPGSRFYTPDGSCNNPADGTKGQAGRPHKRLVPADYSDGQGRPRTGSIVPLPSARLVSTAMQDTRTRKSTKNTHIVVIWCQFITHDITNTPTISRGGDEVDCRCTSRDPACYNIRVPRNDRQVIEENKFCLPVVRSQPGPDANCRNTVRQQLNNITPYLDAGTVYGSNEFQLNELLDRTSSIGKLKTGDLHPHGFSPPSAPSLPLVTQVHPSLRHVACPFDVHKPVDTPCFFAGDDRANENPALASFHTLFVRMHNRLVEDLKGLNPFWQPQELIDNARLIMSAVTQRITYKEFLPELLGDEYMARFGLKVLDNGYWRGYDVSYDATTSNGFATAALRFGHTLVTSPLSRPSSLWYSQQGPPMSLKDHFFNSIPLLTTNQGGVNSILRGLCKDAAETADTTFVDDLHNFLFAPPGRLGHDLLSINIQRGRDHGLPGYNTYREFCGLKRARTFDDFTNIPYDRRDRLRRLYSGQVDNVDLYIAGIAEDPVRGGLFGATFSCILAYQFRDFKRGDRLWHENGGDPAVFTPAQLESIREYKLSRLLCDDLNDMKSVQPNPFQQERRSRNRRRNCNTYRPLNLEPWKERYSFLSRRYPAAPVEKTAWFPVNYQGYNFRPRGLLNYLRSNQPHDVCVISLGHDTRRVRRSTQYRFHCQPGTIKATDYPNVDASKGAWTDWEDTSSPRRSNSYDDVEIRSCATYTCVQPIAIQVFTKQGVPARQTGEVFRRFSPRAGFICRGQDQQNGRCQDYQVRFFCRSVVKSRVDHSRNCLFYGLCCNRD